MAGIKSRIFSAKEAAEETGLSGRVIRVHCQNGKCPGVKYHEIPGTDTGYYTLTERSIAWLVENISKRSRGGGEAAT